MRNARPPKRLEGVYHHRTQHNNNKSVTHACKRILVVHFSHGIVRVSVSAKKRTKNIRHGRPQQTDHERYLLWPVGLQRCVTPQGFERTHNRQTDAAGGRLHFMRQNYYHPPLDTFSRANANRLYLLFAHSNVKKTRHLIPTYALTEGLYPHIILLLCRHWFVYRHWTMSS